MVVKWTPEQLADITEHTLKHYEQNADSFWEGTREHDVTQNYQAFLKALPEDTPLHLLDFGCGPGRDVRYFHSLGHQVIGLDGSAVFCQMAREYSGCEIWHQNFVELELPVAFFDGIFANASLFHVPSQILPEVLVQFNRSLKPGGILFCSNPRGSFEGWNGERYGYYTEFGRSKENMLQAGFELIQHYYRPEGRPRHEQPWLVTVGQKVKSL